MPFRFSKYEGLGNDFLVVDDAVGALSPAQVARLCDRHFGVGGDGVLTVGVREGRPFMRVQNADGSEPEMCGNGLRCVALYLSHTGQARQGEAFEVDTAAGPHLCRVAAGADGEASEVEVDMLPAALEAGRVLRDARGAHVDGPFEVDGQRLRMTAVSMGNPHAVFFDVPAEALEALGPRIERDPRFIAGANVGFATMTGDNAMALRVWERGVGWTLACGTGACAAAAAAAVTGRANPARAIAVRLPGGPLAIRVGEPGERLRMTGPARRVFVGEGRVPGEASP